MLERTLTGEPPGEATHWTGRAMAALCGLSLTTVQRIWRSHRLQPHRVRTFKRSTDPRFAAKLDDVVGLYMAPPRHAVVLSIDEKSQIQALDRTQPGLPLKPGKCATLTPQALRCGVFRSVDDLVTTIDRYVASANDDPEPFVWTASAASMLAKLKMPCSTESQH